MKVTSYERRVTSEEGPLPNPLPEGEGTRGVSLGAALLFFLGLGAGVCAVGAGVMFLWAVGGQAAMRGAAWVGWVLRVHPGLVMIGLLVVAVGALRLSRWADEKSAEDEHGREQ